MTNFFQTEINSKSSISLDTFGQFLVFYSDHIGSCWKMVKFWSGTSSWHFSYFGTQWFEIRNKLQNVAIWLLDIRMKKFLQILHSIRASKIKRLTDREWNKKLHEQILDQCRVQASLKLIECIFWSNENKMLISKKNFL